jgi:hypothetical protein
VEPDPDQQDPPVPVQGTAMLVAGLGLRGVAWRPAAPSLRD